MGKNIHPGVALLVAVTVALAIAVGIASWTHAAGQEAWLWVAACALGEVLWIRLPLDGATISMAACFEFAVLLLLPRGAAMAVTAFSVLAGETLFMRKPPIRSLFNAAQASLAVAAASFAFHALGQSSDDPARLIWRLHLLPLLAAAASYYLVNRGAVSVAVAVNEGTTPWRAWRENFGNSHDLLSSGAVFSLGTLFAVCYSLTGMTGMVLLLVPLLLACDAYRRFLRERQSAASRAPSRRAAA